MNYKELGNTGVRLPEIGFGTWRYRGGVRPLRKAIEQGAALIDTAEAYESEEVVGEAVGENRGRVFIATKASPRNFRRADLLRAAERSLARLRTSYIDLYQLHWPNYTVPIEETMAGMEELIDAGKIRFIGVSNFSVAELKQAQMALSRHRIVSNQLRYSLIERTVERSMLDYCKQNQITILAFSPLGESFANISAADPEDALTEVAAATGRKKVQLALNWVISKANVIAIPKASTEQHVIEDCEASDWRISGSQYELLKAKIRFEQRGRIESAARRYARHLLQLAGRQI